jgi:hypothetical protein
MKKVILLLLIFTAVCYFGFADEKVVSNESGLKDLNSLETLKRDFNVHQNKVRIVTLLSPT